MTNRLLPLLALLTLTACTPPEAVLMESAAKSPAPGPADSILVEPVMEAPVVLEQRASPLEQCSGDGIGGTGCPDR